MGEQATEKTLIQVKQDEKPLVALYIQNYSCICFYAEIM